MVKKGRKIPVAIVFYWNYWGLTEEGNFLLKDNKLQLLFYQLILNKETCSIGTALSKVVRYRNKHNDALS